MLTLGIPFLVGYLVGGTALGLEVMVWGGLVRIFVWQHVTFSINSICHMFGRQAYRSRDESRNVRWLAPLSFGESWHNDHHAFPSSARHGLGTTGSSTSRGSPAAGSSALGWSGR